MMRLATLCAFVAAVGCGSDTGSLAVDLRTDLVPGVEFDRVEVSVGEATRGGAHTSGDFLRGERVATFEDQPPGTVSGELRLFTTDGRRILRPFQAEVRGSASVITVVVSRDCREVVCPGTGAPTATACLGGRCGDPRCAAETPEFCDMPECDSAADCPAAATCSEAVCELGACLYADSGECATGEYCDVERGCMERPGVDAGSDAGVDAPIDAPDAGPGDDFAAVCPDDAQPLLQTGLVVQRVGRPPYTSNFAGSVEVQSFVPRTYRGAAGEGVMDDTGTLRLTVEEAGEWYLPLQVVTRDGVRRSCARIINVPASTRIHSGADWNDPDAFNPTGLPTADEDVITSNAAIGPDDVLPRRLYVRPLRGDITIEAPIRSTRVMVTGGADVTLATLDAATVELGGRMVIPSFDATTSVVVQAPLILMATTSAAAGVTVEFTTEDLVTLEEPTGPGQFAFSGGAHVRVGQLVGAPIVFRGPDANLEVVGTGVVELGFSGPNAPHVVLAGRGAIDVRGDAASIDVRFTSELHDLQVTGTLSATTSITLDREVVGAASVRAPRLILGPNFDAADTSGFRVDACEPTADAPRDICTRFGL